MNDDLRMNGYYFGFDKTGITEIDEILSAIAHAGKAFHHTDDWQEDVGYMSEHYPHIVGNTPIDWIQNAANRAATKFNSK